MTVPKLRHLFSPLTVGAVTFKNRIFSTGHQTVMFQDGLPTDRLIAYQTAKAKGGAALVITESSRVHPSSYQAGWVMDASTDRCLDQLTNLASSVHEYDCKIFGQLGHPGAMGIRRHDNMRREVYSASAMRDYRYKNVARPMSREMIAEVVTSYAEAAHRYQRAGYDGIEIMASHGVLPAQFLNPNLNQREDEYGGSLENRMRFLNEVLVATRALTGIKFVIGTRLSLDEKEQNGLELEDSFPICERLDRDNLVDYFNITGGTMNSDRGAIHIVPPMTFDTGYLAKETTALKTRVGKPIFMAGRINQLQIAEDFLTAGTIDMCGMTRAMIADPEMANKAASGNSDDIIACIACNQACIGHLNLGTPISCIQNPSTGRELENVIRPAGEAPKKVLVIGGGPAGMKAAITMTQRGHKVTLHERSGRLGGQVKLAQSLPTREEFGGLITNMERQLQLSEVEVIRNSEVTVEIFAQSHYDGVILAAGARPYLPDMDLFENIQVVHAQDVVSGNAKVGANVAIFDWPGDWTGVGVAEKCVRNGSSVHLVTEDKFAASAIPNFTRDVWLGNCLRLGVKILSNTRFYGAQDNTCFFENTLSGEPVILEGIDTLILSTGHSPEDGLEKFLVQANAPYKIVGDCLSPRTAEEAVYEGWKAGLGLGGDW